MVIMRHTVVCLSVDGSVRSFRIEQERAYTHFGGKEVGFCGAIVDLNVVALTAMDDDEDDTKNVFCVRFPHFFEKPTSHEILLIGSDERGEACDVEVDKVVALLT